MLSKEQPQEATNSTYLNSRGSEPTHSVGLHHIHADITLPGEPLPKEPTSVPYLGEGCEAHLRIPLKKEKYASSTQTVICLTWKQNVGERCCCGRPDGWLFTSALNSADFGSIPSSSRKCFTARSFHFWESVSLTWPWPKSSSPSTNKLFFPRA